jgi:hypothetical protein
MLAKRHSADECFDCMTLIRRAKSVRRPPHPTRCGLSGSQGVDEPCANAGIDKVKDQLQ